MTVSAEFRLSITKVRAKLSIVSLAVVFVSFVNYSIAQNRTQVEILFAEDLRPVEATLQLNNGLEHLILNDSIRNNEVTVQEEFFSPFAHLYVEFAGEGFEFFVGEAPAVLKFRRSSSPGHEIEYEASGAIEDIKDTTSNIVLRELQNYKPELSRSFEEFLSANHDKIQSNDSINHIFSTLLKQSNDRVLTVIKKYPNKYYSFSQFKNIALISASSMNNNTEYLDKLLAIFEEYFPKEFTESEEGHYVKTVLIPAKNAWKVGSTTPDIQLTTLSGAEYSLRQLRGRYVLIDFWATWCPPCLEQLPDLKDLRHRYSDDKLKIIGVNADVNIKDLTDFIEEDELSWDQV